MKLEQVNNDKNIKKLSTPNLKQKNETIFKETVFH